MVFPLNSSTSRTALTTPTVTSSNGASTVVGASPAPQAGIAIRLLLDQNGFGGCAAASVAEWSEQSGGRY